MICDVGIQYSMEILFDISDASHDETAKLWALGPSNPLVPWMPSFCVLREDLKTLTFHEQEEVIRPGESIS